MNIDPLFLFLAAGMFSPGPNTILLTTFGAKFGFVRTFPHLMGVVIGVGIIGAVTGLGIGALILAIPGLEPALKLVAAAWISWMAYSMWRSSISDKPQAHLRPFTFLQAVLFQWVNPKVWAVALAASAGYSAGLSPTEEALRLATAFSGINFFVYLFWTFAGSLLRSLLQSERSWRWFMTVMTALLAASAGMIFL